MHFTGFQLSESHQIYQDSVNSQKSFGSQLWMLPSLLILVLRVGKMRQSHKCIYIWTIFCIHHMLRGFKSRETSILVTVHVILIVRTKFSDFSDQSHYR